MFDIHSPRVPPQEELQTKIKSILNVLPPATSDWMYVSSPPPLDESCTDSLRVDSLVVNPDCGLKTRGWPEVEAALVNMVAAAKWARTEFAAKA